MRWMIGTTVVLMLAAGGLLWTKRERLRLAERLSPLWVRTIPDVPYGSLAENRLDILDRRWGSQSANRPGVVIFHGGGWIEGGREDMLVRVCHRYLEHGFVVANVGYRKGSIAAAVEDAVLALEWFVKHAPGYGASKSRIVVTGESAGGHLALMAAFQSREPVAAVVNFYGVSDLTAIMDRPAIRAVLASGNVESAARTLSPLTHVRQGLPPVLSIHGTADKLIPLDQTASLTRAIRESGGEAAEHYIEGGRHGFVAGHQQQAYAAVFEFLKSRGILD